MAVYALSALHLRHRQPSIQTLIHKAYIKQRIVVAVGLDSLNSGRCVVNSVQLLLMRQIRMLWYVLSTVKFDLLRSSLRAQTAGPSGLRSKMVIIGWVVH